MKILPFLPPRLHEPLSQLPSAAAWQELRLVRGSPLLLVAGGEELWVGEQGAVATPELALCVTDDDVERALELITHGSLYAWEEELAQGFLTLPGGHRVGLAGRVVLEHGKVRTMRDIHALVYRIGHEVHGAGMRVAPALLGPNGQWLSTLIVAPPGCGKTTLLRDLTRLLATGDPRAGLVAHRVALVDERSEVAACYQGRPQLEVGPRTTVLDGCPKAVGIGMALRALGPEVIVTDEIGRPEDAEALCEALRAGVTVLATAHAPGAQALLERPALRALLAQNAFERIVTLSRRHGPGTVEQILSPKELT